MNANTDTKRQMNRPQFSRRESTVNKCTWRSHYRSILLYSFAMVVALCILGECPSDRVLPSVVNTLQWLFHLLTRVQTHIHTHFGSFFFTQLSCAITWYQILSNAAGVQSASTRHSANTQAPPPTLTAGFGSVPLGSLAAAHDTCQSGVALEQVAGLTIKCHHGAQLVVCADSRSIHYTAWIKARLPKFCCKRQRKD